VVEYGELSICAQADLTLPGQCLATLRTIIQQGGKQVTSEDIARARQHGATDKEIHDTVLIAAAFCMHNRYVDGLATWQPRERDAYREMGEQLAHQGYVRDRFQEGQKTARA
jgi:hypothetical protein